MRRKISTLLDETLFRRTKLEAVRQGKQISEVVGEALNAYLDRQGTPAGAGGVVAQSWQALPLSPTAVVAILEEEDGLFDA